MRTLEFQGSDKRQAVDTVTPLERGGPRLSEDFVPASDGDILRWMHDRQADVQQATMTRNGHDVASLCHIMGSAATSWSAPTMPLSMVSNSVR